MKRITKLSTLFLSLVFVFGLLAAPSSAQISFDVAPAQIGVAMTEAPQHSVNITWTTISTNLTNPTVTIYLGGEVIKTVAAAKTNRSVSSSNLRNESGSAVSQKAFYEALIDGLDPDTTYTYVCGAEDAGGASYVGEGNTFKTAPAARDEFTFIYLADTQSSGVNGKAITANSGFFKNENASFIYIAGDLTDTAANEGQWETFFNQKAASYANDTLVNNNYESAMSDFVISAVQGNHDNNTFAGHLTYPATGGTNITYAYTYGSARFIMLNFENTATRPQQETFLRAQTADAKADGLWIIVGFHKSIYSGASHMTDSDVINARQYWSPIFAELDVDVVLQGHDHVLSRGFVSEWGENMGNTWKTGPRTYMANKPSNAPLYYVGNCASTLKFYSPVSFTTSTTNRVVADYGFLDLNSARPAGHVQNPEGPQTGDSLAHPTYTTVTVSDEYITFNTYMFSYDRNNDVAGEPYLYDTFTVTRTPLPWAGYDKAVDEANAFFYEDFSIYTVDSVSRAKGILFGALESYELKPSYTTLQSEYDRAAAAIKAALKDARAALAVRLVSATPEASVNKLNGNKNDLTITVTELYADGRKAVVKVTISINNNAAGTYNVGSYRVYVDTKGNTQIRECYIVK